MMGPQEEFRSTCHSCQVDEPSIGHAYRQDVPASRAAVRGTRALHFEEGIVSLKKLKGLLSLCESSMHTSHSPSPRSGASLSLELVCRGGGRELAATDGSGMGEER